MQQDHYKRVQQYLSVYDYIFSINNMFINTQYSWKVDVTKPTKIPPPTSQM